MNWIEKDIDVTSTDHEVFPHEHKFSIENFNVEETSNTISTVGQLLTANHVLYDPIDCLHIFFECYRNEWQLHLLQLLLLLGL